MKNLMRKNAGLSLLLIGMILLSSFMLIKPADKPTFYLIGDSTVKNGKGKGDGGLWGWGNYIAPYFDTTRISVENDALGGSSSRTFQTLGLWDKVLAKVKPGDFVIMQFGHNDAGALDDTARARGTIKGIGNEQQEIYNPKRKIQEVVHTYGWYMRKYITDIKAKGATPIICSPIPRNVWKDGKSAGRNDDNSYGQWARELGEQTGTYFVDLNKMIADDYDEEGEAKVKSVYFGTDATHTLEPGAQLNAKFVIQGIRSFNKLVLNKYLK
ncbi:rhamnogalacturonan acetylesterase [Mucilaginibacter sp. KACC 22773]|jgi:lysophospholipase L1-like esterase|uniref:rhamnogalacturonan acetylesterase n=1 Tax=Mucilaginibacter sp. KACC 22773 TaxID=3025671 RepID=UPI002365D208|nr:rhamnogalacturonan acetylesterase [Mucilaginibacter sp. KACC 22773]WDF80434.1 rhamnogalacturonan acetylesterase [Mucilaginibacter sp. KACC 22773]